MKKKKRISPKGKGKPKPTKKRKVPYSVSQGSALYNTSTKYSLGNLNEQLTGIGIKLHCHQLISIKDRFFYQESSNYVTIFET